MSDNKTGKYLKYAIGEIVLVVIGILIALQINNWNNHRIEANREQSILKNLRSDFNDNIDQLNGVYDGTKQSYLASIQLLEIIKADDPINPVEIEKLLNSIINDFSSLDPSSSSIEELINSGSLNIIKDDKLRERISNWSLLVADSEDDIEIYYEYMFNIFIPSLSNKTILRNIGIPNFLMEQVDIPQISSSNYTMDYDKNIRTLNFENEVYNNAVNIVYVLNNYNQISDYLNDTLELIESNIQ